MTEKDIKYLNHRFDRIEAMLVLMNSRIELLQKTVLDNPNLYLDRTDLEIDIVRLNRDVRSVLDVFRKLDDLEDLG